MLLLTPSGRVVGSALLGLRPVKEYGQVRNEALVANRAIHFGRVFPLCVEQHSELLAGQRKCKGGVVFEGSFVSDQSSNVAAFEEFLQRLLRQLQDNRRYGLPEILGDTARGRSAGLLPERVEGDTDADLSASRPIAMGSESKYTNPWCASEAHYTDALYQ